MKVVLPNEAFLEGWQTGKISNAILESEVKIIESRLAKIQKAFMHLVDEKVKVSGGDDWHDGAFRATDAAAIHLSDQKRPLLTAMEDWPRVAMPEPTSDVVSIGSRVGIRQNDSATYSVDLVGLVVLHDYDNDDLAVTSINSPLGTALIGHRSDTMFEAVLGDRIQQIRILETAPSPELQLRENL